MNHFKIISCMFLMFLALPAWAQRIDQSPAINTDSTEAPFLNGKIAAIVNDSVISTHDIRARVKLAILSSGLPNTPDVQARLVPQILRGLIDEQLQMQEAKRLEITISNAEIDQALNRIAVDNNIVNGDMRAFIKSQGGSPESLATQIRASLAWTKVIQRSLRPRVEIGDDEVDAVISRIRANTGKEEYAVSEIFLAVDNPKDEDQVRQLADNLIQQIKSGTRFSAIARQFSQGTGAANGGDIGWIQEGQLPTDLNRAVINLQSGEVSVPIRSASGYHILGVREKRTIALGDPNDISITLQQAFRPIGNDNADTGLAEATQIRTAINGCKDLKAKLAAQYPAWRWQNIGTTKLAKVPDDMADHIRGVPTGQASEPIATAKGTLLLFVCNRTTSDAPVNRDAIMNSLGTEKLELQARRLLRDLRRAAYLDVHSDALPH